MATQRGGRWEDCRIPPVQLVQSSGLVLLGRRRQAIRASAEEPGPAASVRQHRSWSNVGLARRSAGMAAALRDRKSTRLNSSHLGISYAVFCLKKKTTT